MASKTAERRISLLGVRIDPLTYDQAVKKIMHFTNGERLHQVVTINPEFIMLSLKNSSYRKILYNADLATADGVGVRIAANFLSKPVVWVPIIREVQAFLQGIGVGLKALLHRDAFPEIPDLITGSDLVLSVAQKAAEEGKTVFLVDRSSGLGKDTAKRAAQVLTEKFPTLKIVDAESGQPGNRTLVARIAKAQPDILFVGFGFPEQEFFIDTHKHILGAKVAIGIGGALDYIVGNRSRPPRLLQGKFEWAWRLIPAGNSPQEYWKRVVRIWTAFPLFPLTVLRWKIRWGDGLDEVRALTLDFGGVTNQNGVEVLLRRGWQIVPVLQWPALAMFYFRFVPLLERGGIAEKEVWHRFHGLFGTDRDLAWLRNRTIDLFTPHKEIWLLVQKYFQSKQVKLAMLTNNVREWMDIWEKRFQLSKYFPVIVASCYEGTRKPNPVIFRVMAERVGERPEHIVFADDHIRNVLQARRLGFKAIQCRNPKDCAEAVEQILPPA